MFTEFVRDQAFVIAWFGLMSFVWFGWARESPVPLSRAPLAVGSAVGVAVAAAFGLLVWRNWSTESALDGRYWVFGVVVAAEVLVIGAGCVILARGRAQRWFGWWVAVGIALHFVPLAWLFADWSYAVLAGLQLLGLVWMLPSLRRGDYPTSRRAGPWMGATFLLFAVVSTVILLVRHGYPFG